MNKVKLGNQGLIIPNIGLGCMGMTGFGDADMYGKTDEKEAIATIHRSLELGGNFFGHCRFVRSFQKRTIDCKSD